MKIVIVGGGKVGRTLAELFAPDAAGQLIENVTKSARRNETINDKYMEKLFKEVTSLYRLDSISGMAGDGKADLGPLPGTAKALIGTFAAVWVLIGLYVLKEKLKTLKKPADS